MSIPTSPPANPPANPPAGPHAGTPAGASAVTPSAAGPTAAFVGASWTALFVAVLSFGIGLWNATMELSEKGFYGTVLLLGLFSAVALQKSVRDRAEGVPVTAIFLGLSWSMVGVAITLMSVGLWNADLLLSEKGFYGLAFLMSLFSAVAVQKNVRDLSTSRPGSLDADTSDYSRY